MSSPSSGSFSSLAEIKKMRIVHFNNEFPSEDLRVLFQRLHSKSKGKKHRQLAALFDGATAALSDEISQLPKSLSSIIPPFENITELANYEELRRGPLGGSVEGVLLCLLELAILIGYLENEEDLYPFDKHTSCLAGMGMGILAAAAVSISQNVMEIPRAGEEVIRIAFRMGVVVSEVSGNLEQQEAGAASESWAYAVMDCTEEAVQAELDACNKSMNFPDPSKIFISAVGRSVVTVTGPPSRLQALFRASEQLRYSKFIVLPIYGGLCHAPHIYTRAHSQRIVHTPSFEAFQETRHVKVPVLSTGTGKKHSSLTAGELVEDVVFELLTGTIRWGNVVAGAVDHVTNKSAADCQILVFATSHTSKELLTGFNSEATGLKVSLKDVLPWLTKSPAGDRPRDFMQSKIAIVGMACRYPGADDNEEFWQLLEDGRDVHRKVPADRFDVDSHTDPTGKKPNTTMTPFGSFINQPGLFDAGFFNLSPREAAETDPMHRLALVTAYEALEQSGYVPNRTQSSDLSRVGTFYGQASDDYREVNSGQDVDTYFISGGCRAFAPGRINYFFKFTGPSFSCDTACSSSLATVQIACTSLWSGDADTIVAGGLNILTNCDAFAGLSRGHFLSKTGSCKTWDCGADGYCRGDGIGSVVLKRLEDAEADNDKILGMILASATNHSANSISITHPHAGAQSELYRKVISRAGIHPFDVNFVELHGTGTQAGDTVEIKSITDVFAPISPRRSSTLHIGTVKSNIGHGEAAAGIASLIKVLNMLQRDAIPPHVGIKTSINPAFPNLDNRNVKIPFQKTAWPRMPGKKRVALVNNFSAAGGNTTLLLEEAPTRQLTEVETRTTFPVTISAKSKISLKNNLMNLLSYLDNNPDISLANLSYTTCARRIHHNHRISVSGSSISQIRSRLAEHVDSAETHRPAPSEPSIAFAFTGQGSFYNSIAKELFRDLPLFRDQILHLDELVQLHGFPSIIDAVQEGVSKEHQFPPIVTQLTIVCVEIALARFWEHLGVKPSVVIGASLGEYAALHVAGVLSASDTIYLAGTRAKCLELDCKIGTHSMMAVRGSVSQIQESLGTSTTYEVACLNCEKDICISGVKEDISAARTTLEADGYKCHTLEVPYAFHSTQMDPILETFKDLGSGVVFKAPSIPIISPRMGDCVYDAKTINADYMARATREPVKFVTALKEAESTGLIDDKTVWVEVGPHPVCCSFLRTTFPNTGVLAPTLRRDEDNWATLSQSLVMLHSAGVELNWNEYYRPFESALSLLSLPAYSWNAKNYWIQYNGDWSLTKDKVSACSHSAITGPKVSNLRTSTVHQVLEEEIGQTSGKLLIQTDVMHPDFFEAANSHRINNCGVVTSSVHADLAFTVAQYLYRQITGTSSSPDMDITNLDVLQGLVARNDQSQPQLIQVKAIADLTTSSTYLEWYNYGEEEYFASATVRYGDPKEWLSIWAPSTHLVLSRIETLNQLARDGVANKLSRDFTYRLFNNLVDYAEKYRGMQSVVLNGFEASADILLTTQKGGVWTVPPYFIDSVCHLAGLIMNGSEALDSKNNFFVTPGWGSMRFAKPLVPGGRYQSYVKMFETEEANHFMGDVYILQDSKIMGMVSGFKFRAFPRLLLPKFFSAPDSKKSKGNSQKQGKAVSKKTEVISKALPEQKKQVTILETPATDSKPAATAVAVVSEKTVETTEIVQTEESTVVTDAIKLISRETDIAISEMTDSSQFANLGVDSLMSLVLSEKFREELGLTVQSSLFLECPSIGDLKAWLNEYC